MTTTQQTRSDLPGEDSSEHRKAWDLLPWLANGTLEGEELHRVLDHLKDCAVCRDELRFLPELRFVVEQEELQATPAVASDRPLAGVMERIEAHEADQPASTAWRAEHPTAKPGRVSDTVVRWWRRRASARAGHWGSPVLAFQALLLVLVVGLGGSLVSPEVPLGSEPGSPARFTTLSQEPPVIAEVPRARLIFAEGTGEHELRQLLLDHGATIVDGPNSLGAYTVRWPGLDGATLDTLRRRPELKFVEPVAGDHP